MSDSNDSKNMDKYGVWIKDSPKDISGEEPAENAISDIDIPSDDDMFNDIEFPMTAEDLKEPASGETEISDLDIDIDIPDAGPSEEAAAADDNADTALSADELSNITGDMEGGADENADTTLSPDELSNITGAMEGGPDENADTTLSPDELMNITGDQEIPTEEAATESADGLDDFNIDSLDITDSPAPAEEPAPEAIEEPAVESAAEEPAVEEPAAPATEEISLDDIPDGEIDLDDFMSDSSSGGGSSEPADGDVDLSAFMDGGDGDVDLSAFMDDAPAAKKEPKPEEIQDEKSLDIDVSFDDSAAEIAQEDTSEDESAPAPAASDEAPADAMFDSFDDEKAEKPAASGGDVSGEEVDLSEFGFDDDDANIGMTNGPDSAQAQKKEVVDYDMKVAADDDSKTPSVQDVVMGNIENSDDTEIEEGDAVESMNSDNSSEKSLEINEKGKEILDQIMGELSSLKNEIKNLKDGFAELKDRPTPAAEDASIPAAKTEAAANDDTGFFGASEDEDDTIALSGNELTNILSSAEFSTEEAADGAVAEEPSAGETVVEEPAFEEAAVEEPAVEESAEPEFEETSIGGEELTMGLSESDMEEPTIESSEITPEDLAGTTDEFGEENVLPEEISVPKSDDITVESSSSDLMDSVVNTDEAFANADETFEEPAAAEEQLNGEAIDEMMQEDVSIADSLDEEKIGYMEQDSVLAEEAAPQEDSDVVSVDDIVKENVSMQSDDDGVAVGVGDDIEAAFEEADATESDIADTALAEKDAYETSVSDIMKDNVSMQNDDDGVAVGIGSDIDAAFEEADATESDIVDNALAEKDAYENSKSLEEEFNLDDGEGDESIPETLDPSVLAAPVSADETQAAGGTGDEIDLSVFDEPVIDETPAAETTQVEEPDVVETSFAADSFDETSVEEPAVEEPAATAVSPAPAASAAGSSATYDTTTISKDLKTEIVSVLSYMDQLLENLPEDKITEFAKSEHFVTYKKLFDELGLS